MSAVFEEVFLLDYDDESLSFRKRNSQPLTLEVIDESDKLLIRSKNAGDNVNGELMSNGVSSPAAYVNTPPTTNLTIEIYKDTPCSEFGKNGFVITDENGRSVFLRFTKRYVYDSAKSNYTESDICRFGKVVNDFKLGRKDSVFTLRTDEASATQYFQFYGYLSQQQNMMQDYIRTSTYQRAILSNMDDFRGKVVLDVGAGSGILSFFAVQAGARKVYAVEASSMAKHAEALVESNKLQDKIRVIPGKIEEIQLPEQVDIIISEPMGYMLFNERMLETYLHAKKWLAPGGNMFPTRGDLHIAPFSDAQLFTEQLTKANFWFQQNFHGVDLTALRSAALKEYFYQPVVDTFDIRICIAKSNKHTVDFLSAHENDLHTIDIPLKFQVTQTDEIHGLAFWFDVAFFGSQQAVWLSTSPTQPLTHWYQVRCLIDKPLFVQRGHTVSGRVVLVSNRRQSYNVQIDLQVDDVPGSFASNNLDLKNPYFRYTGAPVQPPPGCNNTSPSEDYWQQLDSSNSQQQQPQQTILVNGTPGATLNGSTIVLNGATLTNGIPVAALNTAAQSLQAPVNLTAQQFDPTQQQQSAFQSTQHHHQQQMTTQQQQQQMLNQSATQQQVASGRLNTASPSGGAGGAILGQHGPSIINPYGSPLNSNTLGGGQTVILGTGGASLFQPSSSAMVAGINNMNFPVNQSLMIGDYAAAVGSQIPPYKPM